MGTPIGPCSLCGSDLASALEAETALNAELVGALRQARGYIDSWEYAPKLLAAINGAILKASEHRAKAGRAPVFVDEVRRGVVRKAGE